MAGEALVRRVSEAFRHVLHRTPEQVSLAPGRVNLIGEHTDYNDGLVFPMAVDRYVAVAFASRGDRLLRVHALDYGETEEVRVASLSPPGGSRWIDFVSGMAWALASAGYALAGADLVIGGDLPRGAGLSSSAALELAVARALTAVASGAWDPVAIARLAQRAENDFVGVACGIMDPLASAACREGHALLLDCRTLGFSFFPLPESVSVVVMDTGTRRSLAKGTYNQRRATCARAVRQLQDRDRSIQTLRDVSLEELEGAKDSLDAEAYRRARHVLGENLRVLAMGEALGEGDLARAGRLLNASHESLRDLYEVSSPELDLMTRLARDEPGCWGARMTGAGFGGCAIALVPRERRAVFADRVASLYGAETGLAGEVFPCRPVGGARLVETSG